jgi:hypothetical protein
MFIPFVLVEYLLGKDYTAREAYLTVYPLLEATDLLEICRPLVEFLQVASTHPANRRQSAPTHAPGSARQGRLPGPPRCSHPAPHRCAVSPAASDDAH